MSSKTQKLEPRLAMTRSGKLTTLKELRRIRGEFKRKAGRPLTLKVTIPAPAVPMFRALAEVTQAQSEEEFGSFLLCKGLVSDDVVQKFDNLLNDLL